ncbi:acyl-CoA thioesterase domain-containing protein [Nocardia sp. NPDC004711]
MAAFFESVGGQYVATEWAVSPWAPSQVAGTAVCGLLAREAETHNPGTLFVPARFTVDLFRPVVYEPIRFRSEVVRDGRRVRVVDVALEQAGEVRVRATLMYLAAGEQSPGQVWQPDRQFAAPPPSAEWNPIQFKFGEQDWTGDFAAGLNGDRKSVWHDVAPMVEGESNSPLQMAAYAADTTSMLCNWGSAGIGYINCDVTLTLSRLPESSEVGLQAQERITAGGIAIAAATLYDRSGPLGVSVASGISNTRRAVDPAAFAAEVSATAQAQ